MPAPQEPVVGPLPVLVADCPHCGALFGVASADPAPALQCPACRGRIEAASLALRPLRMAELAAKEPAGAGTDASRSATDSAPKEQAMATPPPGVVTRFVGEGPTLADWMRGGESEPGNPKISSDPKTSHPKTAHPKTAHPNTAAPKASDPKAADPKAAESTSEAATPRRAERPSLSDFRFDFGAGGASGSPLFAEPSPEEAATPRSAAQRDRGIGQNRDGDAGEVAAPRLAELLDSLGKALGEDQGDDSRSAEPDAEPPRFAFAEELVAPARDTDAAASAASSQDPSHSAPRRSWAGPVSAAAGLLTVAAPAAYLLLTWPDPSPSPSESAAVAKQEPDAPAPPFIASRGGEAAPSRAVRPAAFESEPEREPEPPAWERSDTPAAGSPAGSSNGPAAAAAETDRYAAPPSKEPNPFAALDGPPQPMTVPQRPTAGTVKPLDNPAEPAEFPPLEEPSAAAAPTERPVSLEARPTDGFGVRPALGGEALAIGVSPAEPDAARLAELNKRPLGAPRYSIAELAAATAESIAPAAAFAGGDLAAQEQVSAMGQNYARLCLLAQMLTLLDPAEDSPGRMTVELEAADVFRKLFRGEPARANANTIAGQWITWEGRPHGGVFFAAKPTESSREGDAYEYEFDLGDGASIPVVTSEPIDVDRFVNARARFVGVIGVVVESPRDRIPGYTGDAERAVWARKTLPLPKAAAP